MREFSLCIITCFWFSVFGLSFQFYYILFYCPSSAAKNVILAGVKSVTLHDEGVVELWDLSSNFVFSESDIGKNRALASAQKLQDLNNSVIVHTLATKLVKEQLSKFEVYQLYAYFLFSSLSSAQTDMMIWNYI